MKARIATIISLVGVLAAGSAAAMVNTRVLESSAPEASTPALLSVIGVSTPTAAPLPANLDTTLVPASTVPAATAASNQPNVSAPVAVTNPRVSVPSSTSVSSGGTYASNAAGAKVSSVTSSTPPVTTPEALPSMPATTIAKVDPKVSVYDVGDAGLISIQSLGGTLSISAVTPGVGWKVIASTPSTATSPAKVTMASSSVEVTFSASLAGGNIVTSVTSRSVSVPTTQAPSIGGGDHEDDDREDDGHEEDDHEDDDD